MIYVQVGSGMTQNELVGPKNTTLGMLIFMKQSDMRTKMMWVYTLKMNHKS